MPNDKFNEVKEWMKDHPYPPSWYGPDGELTADSKELIAFEQILSNHDFEICDAMIEECISHGIDYEKYFITKCKAEDIGPC